MNRIAKSVIALALAAPAISMVALARDARDYSYDYNDVYEPGSRILFTYDNFYRDGSPDGDLLPGEVELSNDYFSVSSKTFSKGSNLVKSIYIDDDEEAVVIELIPEYLKEAPDETRTSVSITKLAVKAKKSIKDGSEYILSKGKTYEFYDPTYDTNKIYLRVGYELEEYECNSDGQDINITEDESVLVKWTSGDSYGMAQIYYDDYAYAEGRVYKNDKVLYSFTTDLDSSVYKKYPEADLSCIHILGTFPSKMTFYLYADEDQYVYRYDNGKITTSGLKWRDDDAAWVGTITEGYCYLISDIKLKTTSTGSGSSSGSSSGNRDNWVIIDDDEENSNNNNNGIYYPSNGNNNNNGIYYPSNGNNNNNGIYYPSNGNNNNTYYPNNGNNNNTYYPSNGGATITYPSYPNYFNPETGGDW